MTLRRPPRWRSRPGLPSEGLVLAHAFLGFAGWRAVGAAGLIAVGSLFDGLGLLFLVPILDLVVGPQPNPAGGRLLRVLQGPLGEIAVPWRLPVVLLLFAGLMLLRGAVLRSRDETTERLQLEFVEHVRLRLVRRLASAGWSAVAGANHSRVLQALSVEIHQVGVASSAGLLAAVATAMLVAHCILALALAPLAGAFAIAFAVAAAAVTGPYLARARRLGRSIVEAHLGMAEGAAAFMGGLKLALAQGLEERFVAGYAAVAASSVRDRVQFGLLKSGLRNLTTGAAAMTGALTIFMGVEVFHLPTAVLLTLLVALSRMGVLAGSVQQSVQQIAHSLPGYAAILEVEAGLAPPSRTPGAPLCAARVSDRDAALIFCRVDYAHDLAGGRAGELVQADLVVPRGAFLGITGPSGVGKTTFLDLAAGVLRPRSGAIYAFGEALDGPALAKHREWLAYVAQDPFLFDDSIRANLAWAAPGRSDADMWNALAAVGADRFLRRLAQGLDTRIGHRGALLSAGERQRLALACAVLRRPRLLLLDEATNALDPAAEEAVLRAIWALDPGVTLLMVAHRTETLRFCDQILDFPGPIFRSPARAAVPRWSAS